MMRKRITVAPGVRVNVSKRGVGASVGGKGGRYSVHSSGRRTVSAGSGVVAGVYLRCKQRRQETTIEARRLACASVLCASRPARCGVGDAFGRRYARKPGL